MKVVFFDTIAFNVKGTAVYKYGVLLFPIFLFWSSKVSKLKYVCLLSFGLITYIFIIASPVDSKYGIE